MKAVGSFTVPADHPSLAGHFPGRPILPGVVLLDEMLAALAASVGLAPPITLDRVKFEAPALPGDTVTLLAEADGAGGWRFRCECGDRRLATGRLAPDGPR